MSRSRIGEDVYRTKREPKSYHLLRDCPPIKNHLEVYEVSVADAEGDQLEVCEICLRKLAEG